MKKTYKVQTQLVTLRDPATGTRLPKSGDMGGVMKSGWRTWARHNERANNLLDAIRYIKRKATKRHIGGIVVIRPVINGRSSHNFVKIYQAKYGNDERIFSRFEPNPAANYWKGKLTRR